MHTYKYTHTHTHTHAYTDTRTDERTNGRTDERTDERTNERSVDVDVYRGIPPRGRGKNGILEWLTKRYPNSYRSLFFNPEHLFRSLILNLFTAVLMSSSHPGQPSPQSPYVLSTTRAYTHTHPSAIKNNIDNNVNHNNSKETKTATGCLLPV